LREKHRLKTAKNLKMNTSFRKKRPESRMGRLTQPQQDLAFDHCHTIPVRDAVLWLKAQFNLQISKSALALWLRQQRVERSMAAELAALRDNQHGATLVEEVFGQSTPLTIANSVLFASAVFNEFRKPEAERDQNRLVRYMDLALKARDLEIRASAVQLNYERMRRDSSMKSATTIPPDPDSIAAEREKTKEAMVLLFGERPIAFKSNSNLPVTEMDQA
jgi:hypothetical protein